MDIIYQDKDILVLNKEAGILVQGDITGRENLYCRIKDLLSERRREKFIGIVHRLDYPVSGVLMLALSVKFAGILSEQFRKKDIDKEYYAVVENKNDTVFKEEEEIMLYCRRENHITVIEKTKTPGTKEIGIIISKEKADSRFVLLKIIPVTGRKHQIRAVLSFFNIPVIGDKKYGSRIPFRKNAIALHCRRIKIYHPFEKKDMEFKAELPDYWEAFGDIICELC